MPADLPGWLREEAQKLRKRGGPPRGGEAVAIITEHYARVAEEMLAAEVAEDIAGLRARVAYLENELDEERAAATRVRSAYDLLVMGGKGFPSAPAAPPDVVGTPDRVWLVHHCTAGRTWVSDTIEPPDSCPRCGAANGWFEATRVDRLPEE